LSNAAFLWRYARRYAGWIAGGILSLLVFAGSMAFLLALSGPLLTKVIGVQEKAPDAPQSAKLAIDSLQRVYAFLEAHFASAVGGPVVFIPLLFMATFLLRSGSDFVAAFAFQHVGFRTTTDIRNDLYAKYLVQTNRFHARHPSGELVSRLVGDIAQMQSAVSNRLLDLFQCSFLIAVQLAMLFRLNARLAAICLIAMPLVLYPIVRFGRSMRKASLKGQERLADLTNLVAEGVRGHRVVKAFGAEGHEAARFSEATRRHLRVNLRAQTLANLSGPVVESFGMVLATGLLIYVGRQIESGAMSSEAMFTFLTALLTLYDPIRRLNRVNIILQQALAAGGRVKDVLLESVDVAEPAAPTPFATFSREIRFADVQFSYEQEPVLHGVDLTVRRGQVVALVGASGAGKSTLVNLLPRFFDPTAGRVTLDGVDVRDMTLVDLRRQLALVTQETMLFDDTVAANIAYGDRTADRERVVAAARAAFADDFVRQLPAGYDSRVGESGSSLSGGQRQRLAIARAIYKNAPILILDEATNQLDSESESLVQSALSNLMQGRTTLVIAHRLSTVVRADQIVVLDQGRIVEQGTHAELLERGGAYRKLYDLQFQTA
jgi:subfamily B ATP-binding cassette protein MsbA